MQPNVCGEGGAGFEIHESLQDHLPGVEGRPSVLCRWFVRSSRARILFLYFSPVAEATNSLSCLLSQA